MITITVVALMGGVYYVKRNVNVTVRGTRCSFDLERWSCLTWSSPEFCFDSDNKRRLIRLGFITLALDNIGDYNNLHEVSITQENMCITTQLGLKERGNFLLVTRKRDASHFFSWSSFSPRVWDQSNFYDLFIMTINWIAHYSDVLTLQSHN